MLAKMSLPSLEEIDAMMRSGALASESRKLTTEERAQAKEDRKNRAQRNHIGEKGEAVFQGFLERKFKRDFRKSPVIPNPHGMGFYSTDVDLIGSLGSSSRSARCEIKTTRTKRIPFSSFNKNERRYMAKAIKNGEIAFVGLVWLDSSLDVVLMHAIPWSVIVDLERDMSQLYGGKSLGKKDWKKLQPYAILKENGRYVLPTEHWLTQYLIEG